MPSICFVALNAYNMVSDREDLEHIGGAEVQQGLIARELVRRGYRVSFVTRDLGQPDGIEHNGMRVFKTCADDDGLPGIRFIHPRWTSLRKAMGRADADIYYQRTGGLETGQVAMWCRRKDRRFVFAAATSYDCDSSLLHISDLRSRWLYRSGLRAADRVVVQTLEQQHSMQSAFGVSATVIRSCAVNPTDDQLAESQNDGRPRIVWLGRFSKEKRLERLLDLADRVPACDFDVLGNAGVETEYARSISRRAGETPNVHLVGRVPHHQVDAFYRRSSFLLCTSVFEGFPNTFVEAWARGVPVVSTVDPDHLITRNELGFASDNIDELSQFLQRAAPSSDEWHAYSSNARAFYLKHHTPEIVVDGYERIIGVLVSQTTQPRTVAGVSSGLD